MMWRTSQRTIEVYAKGRPRLPEFLVAYTLRERGDQAEADGPYEVLLVDTDGDGIVVNFDDFDVATKQRIETAIETDVREIVRENEARTDPTDAYGGVS